MKVRLEIDDSLKEDEIVIRTKEYTEDLKQLISNFKSKPSIQFFKQDEVVFDMYTAITKVDEYIESGMRTKEAIGLVAKEMACKKNELYEAYHKR